MTGGAPGGRLTALLQLVIVLVLSVSLVQGQLVGIAGCQNYQTSPNFNADYVAKLTSETGGYSMLLTSDRPRTSGCQQITFHSNGTLFLSYQDDYAEMRNFTSEYTVVETTITEAGYIEIRVPGGALGTGLSGNIKLYFVLAEDDYFVVATCEPILFPISIQLVHVFIPSSQLGVTTSVELNSTLVETGKLENVESLREVKQSCAASLRGPPSILQIYNFLVKLGILPALPFRSDSDSRAQFYSAYPNSLAYPNYLYPSPYGAPVQSIAYGQAPVSQQIPSVRQAPAYFNSAVPSTPLYPGLTYQNQRPNYVPAEPNKFLAPKVTDFSSAFAPQQSGVSFYTQNQNPGRVNFDPSPFGSQQPGVNYMSGAPFNFQPSRVNYDSSAFSIQSPEVSQDPSAASSQSPGIIYDSSAFNIKSSVVSQDPSAFNSQQSHGINSEPSPFTQSA